MSKDNLEQKTLEPLTEEQIQEIEELRAKLSELVEELVEINNQQYQKGYKGEEDKNFELDKKYEEIFNELRKLLSVLFSADVMDASIKATQKLAGKHFLFQNLAQIGIGIDAAQRRKEEGEKDKE